MTLFGFLNQTRRHSQKLDWQGNNMLAHADAGFQIGFQQSGSDSFGVMKKNQPRHPVAERALLLTTIGEISRYRSARPIPVSRE
jgi:hypothetical protein